MHYIAISVGRSSYLDLPATVFQQNAPFDTLVVSRAIELS